MLISPRLGAFSGGPREGVYMFQPRYMNVHYPSNTDDDLITSTGVDDYPLSTPTSMSGFIQRLKLADLCRQIVDTMPSMFLDENEPDYESVLKMDQKLRNHLEDLPTFFQLDRLSIQESQNVCRDRPHIRWQRLGVHFSLHVRLCRLHRAYHLLGSTDPKYAYSRGTCVRSAHTVLELRRSMDDLSSQDGIKPARFWVVMQHVFIAALTLATDVSFNPGAPDADVRRTKVIAACRMLERSQEESSALVEGIQKSMQTLLATFQESRADPRSSSQSYNGTKTGDMSSSVPEGVMTDQQLSTEPNSFSRHEATEPSVDGLILTGTEPREGGELTETESDGSLDQLWSEFLAAAPDLDSSQWTSLLDEVDLNFEPGTY